jgi:replicative DNA helicase Mcm
MTKVTGMITSRSNIYKMKSELTLTCTKCGDSTTRSLNVPISSINVKKENCPRCQKENCVLETDCTYVNAVTVELQDTETFNEIERLYVILFDEDTIDINLGERVTITGQIEILNESRRQRSHSILFAKSVEYEAKEEIVVTPKDKEAIERFIIKLKGREKIIDQLVSMFDNSVIGHDHVKKGLLLTAVSTLNVTSNNIFLRINNHNNNNNNTTKRRKYRLHSLVIGEPGLAKTLLLKSTKDLVPKSRYESSQNSSGKSLTAIVSKEDESHVLRLGPVPLAKDAICALNELGRMGLEDQGHLLDVMEEEDFTINKYGINAKILSPYFDNCISKPTEQFKMVQQRKN